MVRRPRVPDGASALAERRLSRDEKTEGMNSWRREIGPERHKNSTQETLPPHMNSIGTGAARPADANQPVSQAMGETLVSDVQAEQDEPDDEQDVEHGISPRQRGEPSAIGFPAIISRSRIGGS
jgi:hypothetical protein